MSIYSSTRGPTRVRFAVIVGVVLGLMAFGLTASADDLIHDGDGSAPVTSSTMNLGNVCPGETYTGTMLIGMKRNWDTSATNTTVPQSNDPLRVFGNSAALTLTFISDNSADIAESMTDSAITLPADWLDTTVWPQNTIFSGDTATYEVTLTVPSNASLGASGSKTVTIRATGPNYLGNTITRQIETGKVAWTVVACPTVTINDSDPDPVTPADTTWDIDWEADQTGTYSIRKGGTDCTDGTQLASGNYPTANTEVTNVLNTSDLAYGANTIRVCVTSTNGTGSDTITVYRQVPTTLTYTGATTYSSTTAIPILMKGTLADSQTACNVNGQEIDFFVDQNDNGAFDSGELVADDVLTAGGTNNSSTAQFTTAALPPGLYLVRVEFAGTDECAASSDEAIVSIVDPNDAANGGGWYQITGQTGAKKSVNYGFTTKWDRQLEQYRGQVLVHNKQAWRMKGEILGFRRTTTGTAFPHPAEATGTASLQCWDSGTETWKTADEAVTFKLKFTDTGTPNKKTGATKPDKFTVYYVTSYTPQNSCPSAVSPLVQTTEQALKGGNVLVK